MIVRTLDNYGDAGLAKISDREQLNNVGNSNGRDVYCKNCNEPYENLYILEDFSDEEFGQYVVLGPQLDDPEGAPTRIRALAGCPCCRGSSVKFSDQETE